MRRIILAVMLVGLTVGAHAADDTKKPAGTTKGAAVGALAGHEVGSGHAVAGARRGGRDRPSSDEKGRTVEVAATAQKIAPPEGRG